MIIFSFIPEFVSRLPSVTTLSPLTIPDLRRILTEVRGSLISQYQSLFGYSGVEIRFTEGALDEICKKASERGGGARGLRGVMVSQRLAISSLSFASRRTVTGISTVGAHVRSSVSRNSV
jgi:ATP-dependent Clp protease ATP-binding subunit ClpX